ncbi:ATP-binding protein [Croceibacter atlanticus]|uniref:sensor histidine kinase n=1 Tax=Croceibacter atlanticus TaxID=313588 RepID=UPI001C5D9F58|nr:sensor histidine kinase [Croceibacter atlanticus]MBW4970790.1 ATP-binding protein [Croceibacter atlanticus]
MDSNKSEISILKEKLNQEISKERSDNKVILSLSHEIANLDNNNIRFSVDAGLINRLGKELVGRHETAVAELVKNSYDADATLVSLSFQNCDKPGGKLEISDNGLGMTREQLIKGFMTISSSDKVHNPKSTKYQRTRAGQKGIGRFATQRLGSVLTVITQTKQSETALKVTIKWDDFRLDSNLLLVTNSIVEIEKIKEEGTVLIIDDLRDYWSLSMIKRAYRYISDLLQPFPLSERFEESENDPGFKVEFYKDKETVINEESVFYKNATAEIEGYVDKSGDGFYTLTSSHFDVKDEIYPIGNNKKKEDYKPFPDLRNIHFKAYYFIYNVGLVPKQIESAIRQNAEEYGGIRLYRNGFRVLPYAEKDNDWLALDASVRKRVILTPHGNNNFYGFVELFDKEGKVFQELSSREGLLENKAFAQLKEFIYKVVIDSTLKISSLRGRKTKTSQKDWEKKKPKDIIDEVASVFEEEAKKRKGKSSEQNTRSEESKSNGESHTEGFTSEQYEKFAKKLRDSAEREEQAKKQLLQEIQLLRILASLGLTIGEFVHEIKHHLRAFDLDIDFLDRNLKEDKYQKRTKRLANNLTSFTTYTSYFDKAISENVNRELEPVALKDAVRSFYKVITPDVNRSGITLMEPKFDGYDIFTIPMHKSEWVSILFNFYTNSKKAIKRAQTNGIISISAGNIGSKVYLDFSDNGDGISLENQDLIFDEFYTTSPPSGTDESEVDSTTGTGLGLKIVKDIVSGYGGEVYVLPPEEGFSTTIRIEINRTEIKDNGEI